MCVGVSWAGQRMEGVARVCGWAEGKVGRGGYLGEWLAHWRSCGRAGAENERRAAVRTNNGAVHALYSCIT